MKKFALLSIAALIFAATPAVLGCRQPERTEVISEKLEVISEEKREVIPGEEIPVPNRGE